MSEDTRDQNPEVSKEAQLWLSKMIQGLLDRHSRYELLDDYASGDHPYPKGDKRYVRALRDLQEKAQTNYVGLANNACTQRMKVREFKFNGKVDNDASQFWKANNMELQSIVAINKAARLGDVYGLVSPPDDVVKTSIITIEDPRQCLTVDDPVHPGRALVGLKLYRDPLDGHTVAALYFPHETYTFTTPAKNADDLIQRAKRLETSGLSAAGFSLQSVKPNPYGRVLLIRGVWKPADETAECENGALRVQDRINYTLLSRLVISKSQAYRQRMITGANEDDVADMDMGSDALWVFDDPDTKMYEFQQADIRQLLEAIRDDIGDFAAITQTPVTYLTNKMVNVSGDALREARASHAAKVRDRMEAMGWFFEELIKLCFLYERDERATSIDAETQWKDPEVRTMAEISDMISKLAPTPIPIGLIMERAGFSDEEIERAEEEIEKNKKEMQLAQDQNGPENQDSQSPNDSDDKN